MVICRFRTLLKCNEIEPFLKRIITAMESWLNTRMLTQKIMIKRLMILHKRLQTIDWRALECLVGLEGFCNVVMCLCSNSVLYCAQLDCLNEKLPELAKERKEKLEKKEFYCIMRSGHTYFWLMTQKKLIWLESFDASTV